MAPLVLCIAAIASASPALEVETVCLEPRPLLLSGDYPLPFGLLRLHLRNASDDTVSLEAIEASGLPVWSTAGVAPHGASGVRWCLVHPASPGPGRRTEIRILPAHEVLTRATLTIHFRRGDRCEALRFRLDERPSALLWQGIRFEADLQRLWFGLKNQSRTDARLAGVRVDGAERLDELIEADPVIPAGGAAVFGLPLSASHAAGDDLFLALRDTEGRCAAARVRVHHQFLMLAATEAKDLHLDLPPDGSNVQQSGLPHTLLMVCVTHSHPTFEEAGADFSRMYMEHRASSPALGGLQTCHKDWRSGLTFFPGLADLTLAYWAESLPALAELGTPKAQRAFAELAFHGAGTNGWLACVSTGPNPDFLYLEQRGSTYDETRYVVWDALGHGARGVLYSGSEGDLRAADIGRINEEVGRCRPGLTYAIPREQRDLEGGKVRMLVLQAGLEELIVVVLNRTLAYAPRPPHETTFELLRNVAVPVSLPPGYTARVRQEGDDPVAFDASDGHGTLVLRRLKHVSVTRIGLHKAALGGKE